MNFLYISQVQTYALSQYLPNNEGPSPDTNVLLAIVKLLTDLHIPKCTWGLANNSSGSPWYKGWTVPVAQYTASHSISFQTPMTLKHPCQTLYVQFSINLGIDTYGVCIYTVCGLNCKITPA